MDLTLRESPKQKPFFELLWVWQYKELLKNLVVAELKLQYRGASLGFIWTLLNPLALLLVYLVAFSFVLRFNIDNFTLYLLTGLLHWQFFANATTVSTEALIHSAHLIQNIRFPRIVLPLAVVGAKGIHLMLAMVPYMLLFIPMGGQFWSGMLLYPFIFLLQTIFVIGMALSVSILTIYFRDLKHLLEVGIQMLFWLTPIIYTIDHVPEWVHNFFRINPMMSFVISYQDILYLNQVPSSSNWGLMIFMALGSLALGSFLFSRLQANMEDYL